MQNNLYATDNHGWAELASPRIASTPCAGVLRSEWVVVGAGFTGLSCARRLAELHPDQQIILLDARKVAQGTSGRNSGFSVSTSHFSGAFNPKLKPEFERVNRINKAGQTLLRNLVAQHKIDCDWYDDGFYHTATDTAAVAEYHHFIDYLDQLDIAYTPLDKEQLNQHIGTRWYERGAHVHDGVVMHPAKLVYGLTDSLPSNITLYEDSPVENIDYQQPFVLTTPSAQIKADKLVLAVNYEAAKLGFLNRRLLGSTLAGSFTRVLTDDEISLLGNKKAWGALSLHSGGATVRLTPQGRLNIRNTAEYHGGHLLSDNALQKRQQIHRSAFELRFPKLKHVPFEFGWSGVEGISGNGTNFFQNPKPNLYLAGGYNGSGVSRGTAFGHALAEMASNMQSTLITDCLGSAPAQWLPPRPILDIGAWFTVRKRFEGVGKDR
ncbi:MAG: glycine/D-amino acid oxidase-like deaminating enzyme [Saprospiraceae bacterium]|jgi:glycine/D-amino acid oxidase-like deaminating enzyme